jgi:hypothetical protein
MGNLRAEIIETQKIRSSLLQWKLILVSTLGGAGLGLTGNQLPNAHLILCFIPFSCVYVDLLCRHLNIRIAIIGSFLGRKKPRPDEDSVDYDYENFLGEHYWKAEESQPAGWFRLESMALRYSTILLSIFVIPLGLLAESNEGTFETNFSLTGIFSNPFNYIFFFSGFLGILFSLAVESRYLSQLGKMKSFANEILGTPAYQLNHLKNVERKNKF